MKYTQKELEVMSDFDLNFALCTNFIPVIIEDNQNKDDSPIMVNDIVNMYPLDFCNNWKDCGVLIDDLRAISGTTIEFDDSIFLFHRRKNKIVVRCRNAKRAAVIVYILVKQSNE